MLTVVFQGIESAAHRSTLRSALELFDDAPRVSAGISYKSLRSRRLGPAYLKDTAEDFSILMEAGVYGTPMSADEAIRTANEYYAFVAKNPVITSAIEFRHPSLPDHRAPNDSGPRIIPAWNGRDPLDLDLLLNETGSVAAPTEVLHDKRVPSIMRRSRRTDGTRVLISNADLLEARQAGFNAVLVSAWSHPGRFGEVSLWDGARFLRGSRVKKAEFLVQHAAAIQEAGLDSTLLEANDSRELNRLAAYSYVSWAQSLSVPEDAPTDPDDSLSDREGRIVVLEPEKSAIASTKVLPRGVKRERLPVTLPIFSYEEAESLEEDDDGTVSMRTRALLRPSGETIRVCDSCFLASTCPAYEAASACAFNFPVEVRTDAQVKALLSSMMELQATRIAFARFAEEVNGGYPDAIVGKELDRLFKMAERMKRTEERRERLTVSVESESTGGGTGVLSRIFGKQAQVETPAQPPAIMADVVLAEVIEDEVI